MFSHQPVLTQSETRAPEIRTHPTIPNYRAQRNPPWLNEVPGVALPRHAARGLFVPLAQEPPRRTHTEPLAGPEGSW